MARHPDDVNRMGMMISNTVDEKTKTKEPDAKYKCRKKLYLLEGGFDDFVRNYPTSVVNPRMARHPDDVNRMGMISSTVDEKTKTKEPPAIDTASTVSQSPIQDALLTAEISKPNQADCVNIFTTDQTTVTIKHTLYNSWTLWYLKNNLCKNWEKEQEVICAFSCIEDFGSIIHNILEPSRLEIGCDYSLFKEGIKPIWEESENCYGGRLVLSWNKVVCQNEPNCMDKMWLSVLMLLIGERFLINGKYVNGVVFSSRRHFWKIGVWLSTSKDEIVSTIRDILMKELNENLPFLKYLLGKNMCEINFQEHKQSKSRDTKYERIRNILGPNL